MAHKSVFPIKGMYFTQESFHNGRVAAFAINFLCGVFVGTSKVEDSGVMVLGQSRDQSSALGGRDLRRRKFWRCSR